MLLRQSTIVNRPFYLGVTLLTPAVAISKNGGAFGPAAGVVTELSVGWYNIAFTVADTNTVGSLAWSITGVGVPAIAGFPVDQVMTAVPSFGVTC